MKKILYKYVDSGFWTQKDARPFPSIFKNYTFEYSDNPEYLFYSSWGTQFLKYDNCIKIFFATENVRPDFNQCDYAIGYDRLCFGERYLTKPIYLHRNEFKDGIRYEKRKFCNFLYSNTQNGAGAKLRQKFFNLLSKYKIIDSPGKACNNMVHHVSSTRWDSPVKIDFLSNYKFTIAFENSSYPGYISEKIIHTFQANSVPIYWGDPDITIDFNPESFINIHSFNTLKEAIDYIIFLDNNDEAYLNMLYTCPMQYNYKIPDIYKFYTNIFENGKIFREIGHTNAFTQPLRNFEISYNHINSRLLKPLKSLNLINNFSFDDYKFYDTFNNSLDDILITNNLFSIFNKYFNIYNKLDLSILGNLSFIHNLNILKYSLDLSKYSNNNMNVKWSNDVNITNEYRNIFKILWPHKINCHNILYIRGLYDRGCYILKPDFNSIAIMIGNAYKWLLDIKSFNFKTFIFNAELLDSNLEHSSIKHISKNLVSDNKENGNEITLDNIIKMFYGENIILFIDVNGLEWDIFENIPSYYLKTISQIFCVFHNIQNLKNLNNYKKIFNKICKTHIPIYFNQYNDGSLLGFNDFLVANIWEITFVLRDSGIFTPSTDSYPIGMLTNKHFSTHDVYTGKFEDITGIKPDLLNNDINNFCSNNISYNDISPELFSLFTLDGRIPVIYRNCNDIYSSPISINVDTFNNKISQVIDKSLKYHGNTFNYILEALDDFPVSGKTCLVAEHEDCGCVAIAIAHNAGKVIFVDYNDPICEHDLVQTMNLDDFSCSDIFPHIVFSNTFYEHVGLGRFGDQINPVGDLQAMQKLLYKMDPDGILYLIVPTGPDCLYWNEHRIYGQLRLPLLLKYWTFLASYGLKPQMLHGQPGTYTQPVFVLSSNKQALNIPSYATQSQIEQIQFLASHGAFDRQSYIERYPEVLCFQMDVISYYVLHGARIFHDPTAYFSTLDYTLNNTDIDFNEVNPFYHFLTK